MINPNKLTKEQAKEYYSDSIIKHSGADYVKESWTGDSTVYSSGYYWVNSNNDRFYFDSHEEAIEDLVFELAYYD